MNKVGVVVSGTEAVKETDGEVADNDEADVKKSDAKSERPQTSGYDMHKRYGEVQKSRHLYEHSIACRHVFIIPAYLANLQGPPILQYIIS